MIRPTTRRERAADACRERFHNRAYKPGTRDCPKMALHNLHKLGVKVPFAKGLKYKTEIEGLKALKALGYADLIAVLDGLGLPRIAPAMARTADIVALPTSHKAGALAIYMGNGAYLAYTDQSPNAEILNNVSEFARDDLGYCAWRVIDG